MLAITLHWTVAIADCGFSKYIDHGEPIDSYDNKIQRRSHDNRHVFYNQIVYSSIMLFSMRLPRLRRGVEGEEEEEEEEE